MRKISNRRAWAFLALFLLIPILSFSGCASQNRQNAAAAQNQGKASDILAAAVAGAGPAGSIIDVSGSLFGNGRAAVGDKYMSAVGITCRPVVFINDGGDKYNLAVCAEKDGLWATAPHIFASMRQPG